MLVAAAALLALYIWGVAGLPRFGDYHGAYGLTINHVVSSERQVTNAVPALVFDYRAFDTLGEEFILFIAVVGVVALVREQRDEDGGVARDAARAERVPPTRTPCERWGSRCSPRRCSWACTSSP